MVYQSQVTVLIPELQQLWYYTSSLGKMSASPDD
jgi:hypothetical protein